MKQANVVSTRIAPAVIALSFVTLIVLACAGTQSNEPETSGAIQNSASSRADPASGVTLPLDLYEDKYLYVRGEVNGIATDIVIDSGAGITVVDQTFANTLGLQGAGTVTARGVGGAGREVKLADNVQIKLGSLSLAPLTAAIIDLDEVHEKLGRRMPLILGKELFHAMPVTIDYAGRRVTFHDADKFEPPAGAVILPTRAEDHGLVMIEAQLEDLEPAWYSVDTGSGSTVDFHVPYVKAQNLLQRYPRQSVRLVGGVGGSLPATVVTSNSFTLAGQVFRSVPITLATESQGAYASDASAGTLGAGLLSRFVVTFDLPRERIFFVPNDAPAGPFQKDRLGLSCKTEGTKVVVEYVTPGSPAATAGLAAGDEIVAVDGVELEGSALRERLRKAVRAPAGTTVRLALRGGVERQVKLADYF